MRSYKISIIKVEKIMRENKGDDRSISENLPTMSGGKIGRGKLY